MNDKEYDEAIKTPAGQLITFAYLYYSLSKSFKHNSFDNIKESEKK